MAEKTRTITTVTGALRALRTILADGALFNKDTTRTASATSSLLAYREAAAKGVLCVDMTGAGPNETIPGGKYYVSDGTTLTNCWNQTIDDNGGILDPIPLVRGT